MKKFSELSDREINELVSQAVFNTNCLESDYVNNIADAWSVVAWMQIRYGSVEITKQVMTYVEPFVPFVKEKIIVSNESAPRAICHAALRLKGIVE